MDKNPLIGLLSGQKVSSADSSTGDQNAQDNHAVDDDF